MVLKQIELQNFRLHKNTSLNFSDKLNLISGGNGQGKTSILEAIYYLCTTKNINHASERDVVMFGEQYFGTKGKFSDFTENQVQLFYETEKNKKNFFIDDKQIFNFSSVIGKFPIVSLMQTDHAITQGAPTERRRFIDSVISQASRSYLETLLEFNKTLRQRASLLSQIKETRSHNLFDQLDAWTEALIITGTEVIKQRSSFVKNFNSYMNEAYKQIVKNTEEPRVVYNSFSEIEEENTAERFRKELVLMREDELRRGANLVGPHRDDFIFSINRHDLKRFGSQGQHKTFQIALRFAQFFFMKDKLGKTPIFLMDDIFGELDLYRAGKISGYLPRIGQAFITMTDLTKIEELNISAESILIKVNNGKAIYA